MIQNFPRPINPKIKKQTDDQIAKVGQLNQLVRDINQLQTDPSSPVSYPFVWYPEAGLTVAGPKFTYTDGVELISYHIKGIAQLSGNSDSFEQYLCSVNFPSGQPFLFPGSITGMMQVSGGGDFITTPLANGAIVDIDGSWQPINNFQINLYNYGNNPQQGDAYYYALVASFTTNNSGPITGLMAYDFEFLLPNFITAPTIFQD